MKYSFACYGGSGSTWLRNRLRRSWKTHMRPETFWLPVYFPQQSKSATDFDQQLTPDGYDNLPTKASMRGFDQRTPGYTVVDDGRTIDDVLRDYYLWMREQDKLAVMFSRAPMLGFFGRNKDIVRDTIFIVRHPLHQYISITKPQRHAEFVEQYGGRDTEGGVRFWAEEWNGFVEDALACGMPIVRYEFVAHDSATLDAVPRDVFLKWDSSRRNKNMLSPENLRLLRELTRPCFEKLYGSWDL